MSHPALTPDQNMKRPLSRRPASVSHSPGSDDAVLRLQESLQTRRADLERQRPPAEAVAARGPRVRVGAGGDGVVLGHLPAAAASGQRGGGGGGLAECRLRRLQGADG